MNRDDQRFSDQIFGGDLGEWRLASGANGRKWTEKVRVELDACCGLLVVLGFYVLAFEGVSGWPNCREELRLKFWDGKKCRRVWNG